MSLEQEKLSIMVVKINGFTVFGSVVGLVQTRHPLGGIYPQLWGSTDHHLVGGMRWETSIRNHSVLPCKAAMILRLVSLSDPPCPSLP